VQQLVTNHPTGLRHPNLSPVLKIRSIGEPDSIIAVAGQVGKGRLFAMSDPSATINQMLRYPGNRAFVAGLARYLVDDDGTTHRQGRLFLVVNKFSEEGSFGARLRFEKTSNRPRARQRARRGAARRSGGRTSLGGHRARARAWVRGRRGRTRAAPAAPRAPVARAASPGALRARARRRRSLAARAQERALCEAHTRSARIRPTARNRRKAEL
jgi:hypothetical protein